MSIAAFHYSINKHSLRACYTADPVLDAEGTTVKKNTFPTGDWGLMRKLTGQQAIIIQNDMFRVSAVCKVVVAKVGAPGRVAWTTGGS